MYQNILPLFTINWPLFFQMSKKANFASNISLIFFSLQCSKCVTLSPKKCCTFGPIGVLHCKWNQREKLIHVKVISSPERAPILLLISLGGNEQKLKIYPHRCQNKSVVTTLDLKKPTLLDLQGTYTVVFKERQFNDLFIFDNRFTK